MTLTHLVRPWLGNACQVLPLAIQMGKDGHRVVGPRLVRR